MVCKESLLGFNQSNYLLQIRSGDDLTTSPTIQYGEVFLYPQPNLNKMYHDSFKDAPDRIQNWKGKLQMFEKNPEMLWDLMSRYQIFSSKFPETYFYNDKKVIEFSNSKACGSFNSLFDKIREKTTNQKLLVMIEKCFTRLWENKIIFAD